MQTPLSTADPAELRRQLRSRRRSLKSLEREQYSRAIAERLFSLRSWQRAQRVSVYMATPEEVQTGMILETADTAGKEIYLPVISKARWRNAGDMLFQRYQPGSTRLISNRYGILEPEHRPGTPVTGTDLDLVCVPLVGFNDQCDRIGMGAGYYDRAFSRSSWRRTQLVGLAFSCQQAVFNPAEHDVPMHAILTEKAVFSNKSKG